MPGLGGKQKWQELQDMVEQIRICSILFDLVEICFDQEREEGGRKLKLMDQVIEKKAEAKGGDHEK